MYKIIFTNGVFDIIHPGHIELLRVAKSLGDYLFVGINSDKSVKKIKGDNRPINNQEDRLKVLKAIRYVDDVHIFDEKTPYELIKCVRPDIIVKGGDYKKENVVGSDLAEVVIFSHTGHSTTRIINDIMALVL